MRVVSLIILLLVMGGVAFVFIHEPTRSWVFKKTKDVANQAEGYSLAKTPRDALDNFTKAVKDRNYQAAARYCSEDYAKMLENANEAGRKTGKKLDQIYNVMHNKGLYTPMAIDLLLSMDPFPDTYKVKDGSLKETKKGEVAEVSFEFSLEGKPKPASGRDLTSQEMEKIDPKMFRAHALVPKNFIGKVDIKFDKKSEAWKFEFIPRTKECDYFVQNYKRYLQAYELYYDELDRERKLVDTIGPDLLDVIVRSK